MLPAVGAKRTTVELWVAGVRLAQGKPHIRSLAAYRMDISPTQWANESFLALVFGQHEIILLLAIRFDDFKCGVVSICCSCHKINLRETMLFVLQRP